VPSAVAEPFPRTQGSKGLVAVGDRGSFQYPVHARPTDAERLGDGSGPEAAIEAGHIAARSTFPSLGNLI
jgi:hypothetical protein